MKKYLVSKAKKKTPYKHPNDMGFDFTGQVTVIAGLKDYGPVIFQLVDKPLLVDIIKLIIAHGQSSYVGTEVTAYSKTVEEFVKGELLATCAEL